MFTNVNLVIWNTFWFSNHLQITTQMLCIAHFTLDINLDRLPKDKKTPIFKISYCVISWKVSKHFFPSFYLYIYTLCLEGFSKGWVIRFVASTRPWLLQLLQLLLQFCSQRCLSMYCEDFTLAICLLLELGCIE